MAKRTVVDAVLDVLENTEGVELIGIFGKKHAKIRWRYKEEVKTTTVPRTASDFRASKNAASFVRRQIKEIEDASG